MPGSVGVDRPVDLDGVPEDGLRRRCGRRKAFEDELLLGSAAVEQCIGGGEQLIEDREPKWRFRVGCRLEQGRHLGQVQTADRRLVEVRDQRKHTIIDGGNRLEEIGTVGPLPVDPVVGIVERDRRRGEELRARASSPGSRGRRTRKRVTSTPSSIVVPGASWSSHVTLDRAHELSTRMFHPSAAIRVA